MCNCCSYGGKMKHRVKGCFLRLFLCLLTLFGVCFAVNFSKISFAYAQVTSVSAQEENTCLHQNIEYQQTKEPTCAEAGELQRYCRDCNQVISIIPINKTNNHIYNDEWQVAENGHYSICSVCGESSAVEEHSNVDDLSWKLEKAPTQSEDGEKYKECEICHTKLISQKITKFSVDSQNANKTSDGAVSKNVVNESENIEVKLETSVAELRTRFCTIEDELALANGQTLTFTLKVKAGENIFSNEDKLLLNQAIGKGKNLNSFEFQLFKKLGDNEEVQILTIEEGKSLSFSVSLSNSEINTDSSKDRDYYFSYIDGGEVKKINASFNSNAKTLSVKINQFGKFALNYNDSQTPAVEANSNIWIWVAISAVAVVIISGVVIFAIKHKKKSPKSKTK